MTAGNGPPRSPRNRWPVANRPRALYPGKRDIEASKNAGKSPNIFPAVPYVIGAGMGVRWGYVARPLLERAARARCSRRQSVSAPTNVRASIQSFASDLPGRRRGRFSIGALLPGTRAERNPPEFSWHEIRITRLTENRKLKVPVRSVAGTGDRMESGGFPMAVRTTSRRRNISRVPERIPVEETNLTAKERARLKDPNWVTEDEADAIVAMREIRKGGKTYSLDQVLKENGLTLERSNPRRRPSAASPARRKREAGSRSNHR